MKKYNITINEKYELRKFIGPPLQDSFSTDYGFNEEEIEESYEELQGDEIPLNEQEVEDCEDVENVKTEYVEEQITSKEQKKADRKKRRETKRKTKQKE